MGADSALGKLCVHPKCGQHGTFEGLSLSEQSSGSGDFLRKYFKGSPLTVAFILTLEKKLNLADVSVFLSFFLGSGAGKREEASEQVAGGSSFY